MEKPILLPDSPSFVDLCTLHQHAMRYYRLWIYACNTVLALATLVFTVFAVSVFVDPRISLLSGVELYQPTFIYAYVALILQCGVLQTIGCLGAIRLNQKLLNTYWTLLLLLMVGDIVVGLFWAFRLDWIKSSLRPTLRHRLTTQYRVDPHFTQVWDWVQTHDMCCGVDTPTDFQHFNFNESNFSRYEARNFSEESGLLGWLPSSAPPTLHLPSTCCIFTKWDSLSPSEQARRTRHDHPNPPSSHLARQPGKSNVSPEVNRRHHHPPQSFHSSRNRTPRDSGLHPSLPTPAARKKNPITTTLPNHGNLGRNKPPERGGGVRGPAATEAMTESPPSGSEGVCELPPELVRLSSPASPGTTTSSNLASSPAPTLPNTPPTAQYPTNPPPVQFQHTVGCADKILAWVDHVSDVLFVLGFCIIVFLKGCFLAILRYEIKEMIQKIRLLNGDEGLRSAAMNELIGLTSMYNSGGSQEEEGAEGVEVTTPPKPAETVINEKKPPLNLHPNAHAHRSNSVAAPDPNVKRYKYPPYGNHLNSNNTIMAYRLQRQASIQKAAEVEEDFDSSSALLATAARLNSLPVPIPIPYPRNGNNNMPTVEMTTTTALVNATCITAGATPLATATSSKIR